MSPRSPSAAKRDKPIPTGGLRRTAKVGELVGGQTVRTYATRAANLTRSADGRQAAAERRQLEEAEQPRIVRSRSSEATSPS
jgi:hypothetical protein